MRTPRQIIDQIMGQRDPAARRGISRTFGWYGTHWEPGRFDLYWEPTDAFAAHFDVVHGGAIAALLDSAMGCATLTVLEEDEMFATADIQVQYIRGAKVEPLTANGRVLRRTRQVAFCEAEVRSPEDLLVARGTATCSIFKAR